MRRFLAVMPDGPSELVDPDSDVPRLTEAQIGERCRQVQSTWSPSKRNRRLRQAMELRRITMDWEEEERCLPE
jgi:hypothetical protein